tara:strand:+ start:13796 stop:14527 length:732 start_codon:yes stop_codon:yes gene_type:complete
MLEPWQNFQAEFGRYLRDPANEALPDGVTPRRSRVYEELLFNNICGFLNTCFPVCKSLIEQDVWRDLSRSFFRDWRCHSPRFNDIPKAFLDYLVSDSAPELPYSWFVQLAHYEWVELAVDTFDEHHQAVDPSSGIRVNPSLQNLIYDWPVHQISPNYLPTENKQTFLLVFRNANNDVEFTEVNAPTSALVSLFEQGYTSSSEVLSELALKMHVPLNEAFNAFGLDMIHQLVTQGILKDFNRSS